MVCPSRWLELKIFFFLDTALIEPKDCAIFNLSDVPLIHTEISVLSRGLRFVPTPHIANEFELSEFLDDMQQFTRGLHLHTCMVKKDAV